MLIMVAIHKGIDSVLDTCDVSYFVSIHRLEDYVFVHILMKTQIKKGFGDSQSNSTIDL